MNEMEGRFRNGGHSSGILKNRSSSGCLIIKKKPDGVGGMGSSGGRKLHDLRKEKKRPRLNAMDSLSSDEELLELYRTCGGTGMNQLGSASLYEKGILNHSEFNSENNDFEDLGFGKNGLMREGRPKRSKLDAYDFNEYDDLSDVEIIGDAERRCLTMMPEMRNCNTMDFDGGPSKGDIIYKRRNSFHGIGGSEEIKSGDHYSGKRWFEMKNELPISLGKEKYIVSDDAIRLQGKNGVLKVRVKHKKISEQLPQNYIPGKRNNVVPKSQELTPNNIVIRPSPYSEKNQQMKSIAIHKTDISHQKKRKSLSTKSSEENDKESEDSDSSPKLQIDSVEVHRSMKKGRSGGSMQLPGRAQPNKLNEGKVRRGSGTEKQLLREKIRNMLVSAGWTIDYRPRRGRDYSDAVYINPTGTAYWSIIKAYDALQKQLEEEGKNLKAGNDCSSFAPISEDILSKLTRQTRKKIEKQLKRKKREEAGGKRKKELTSENFEEDVSDTDSTGSDRHEEKLSSFIKHSGKFLKGASKDACKDGSSSNSKMQERGERSSSTSNSRFIHAKKSKKIGRCTLLVRNSEKGLDSESDGFVPYVGKRNLLSWLVDSRAVKFSEKVHYMNRRRTQVMLEGWITRDGIHCGCCSKILSVSKFEIHAASKLRQPFQSIYLSSGASLLQCQIDAWNRQDEPLRNGFNKIDYGDDPNDDTCSICGDGGNLICCDSCPSTFHQNCLDIQMLPPGDWHCPHCSCKFCGLVDVSVAEGNDTRQYTMMTCSLCEKKYHCSCMEETDGSPINSNSPLPFCRKACQELFERLQKLLGLKHELEAGLCWSLIHRTDLGSDTSLPSFPQRVEWNSKLAVALTVMDECFLPIIDRRSRINMIHNVLYNCGSNFARLNYSGFYTALLERGDEIISVAAIRIRGTQFAEMPFIGTRHIYRRQGMCRRLFSAIESALRSLKVEKLIIPAISELMDTWTTVFGFSALEESDKQEMKTMNMLVFPGTDMLQKKLVDQDNANRGLAGGDSLEVGHSALLVSDLTKNSDIFSSPGLCAAASKLDNEKTNDKSFTDFGSQDIMASVDETPSDCASVDVCNDVQLSLHASSADVSNEIALLSSVGIQGTTSSKLQLDKLNESAGRASMGIHGIANSVDFFDAKLDTEVSADCKLTQGASEADPDSRSPALQGVFVLGGTSNDGLLNDFLGNGNKAQIGGILFSKNVSANEKLQSLSEASHADVVMEKPAIESPAEDNNRHSGKAQVDDAHAVLAEVADVCAGSQSLLVSKGTDEGAAHELKAHVSRNDITYSKKTEHLAKPADDKACESLQNSRHDTVDVEKLPDTCNGICNYQASEGEMQHALDIRLADSRFQPRNFFCENSASNIESNPNGNENPPNFY